MSVSLDLLERRDDQGRPLFELRAPYHYRLGPGCVITVPAGYVTNFGTIPRWFAWIVSPTELHTAAIVHDWMCNEDQSGGGVNSGFSRWMADAVLYESLARMGFGWLRRVLVYIAVRLYATATGQYVWPAEPEEVRVE